VRNSSCLRSSIDAIHCFCRERNFDSRTRHNLPHFLNGNFTEVAEMHHGEHSMSARAAHCCWQHGTPSTFSTKNSASLSALMSVEADTGLCRVTRLMKLTARAIEDIRFMFEWSAVVTILHRFRDKPLLHSDLKSCKFHTAPYFHIHLFSL